MEELDGVGAHRRARQRRAQCDERRDRELGGVSARHDPRRFNLGAGFYATPWLGLNYDFKAKDVALGGETFEGSNWLVFPAVHLGRSFL